MFLYFCNFVIKLFVRRAPPFYWTQSHAWFFDIFAFQLHLPLTWIIFFCNNISLFFLSAVNGFNEVISMTGFCCCRFFFCFLLGVSSFKNISRNLPVKRRKSFDEKREWDLIFTNRIPTDIDVYVISQFIDDLQRCFYV